MILNVIIFPHDRGLTVAIITEEVVIIIDIS